MSKLIGKMMKMPEPLQYLSKVALMMNNSKLIEALINASEVEGIQNIPMSSTDFIVAVEDVNEFLKPFIIEDVEELPYVVQDVQLNERGVDNIIYDIITITDIRESYPPIFLPVTKKVPSSFMDMIRMKGLPEIKTVQDAITATARALLTLPPTILPIHQSVPNPKAEIPALLLYLYGVNMIMSMKNNLDIKALKHRIELTTIPRQGDTSSIAEAIRELSEKLVSIIDNEDAIAEIAGTRKESEIKKARAFLATMGLLAIYPSDTVGILAQIEQRQKEMGVEDAVVSVLRERIEKFKVITGGEVDQLYKVYGGTVRGGEEEVAMERERAPVRGEIGTMGGGLFAAPLPPAEEQGGEEEEWDNDPWANFIRRRRRR